MKKCNSSYSNINILLGSTLFFVFCLFSPADAQRAMRFPDSVSRNFNKEVQARQAYWDTMGVSKRRGEFKHFNRWKTFWETRVNEDGSYPDVSLIRNAFEMGLKDYKRLKSDKFQSMPKWEDIGNKKNPNGEIRYGGVGRVNTVRRNPGNPNELWAGSASGGAWRSTDKGQSWAPLYQTEFLSMGVSDIAFSKSNPATVYVATGDFDGALSNFASFSVGIIKTTDGGDTWNTTQNVWDLPETRVISRLWVHPENENIVVAGTGTGILRTADGGQTWTQITSASGRITDIEQKPNNPNVLYASNMIHGATENSQTSVYKSTDAGLTWTLIRSVTGGSQRTALAVTPAAPESIYVLSSNYLNGFHSVIISDDGGTNWIDANIYTQKGENYLGWFLHSLKTETSGQGFYDLAIAVSPQDASRIFIGGVNIWRSTNKGRDFVQVAHWAGDNSPYVHADIHDLIFMDNTLFVGHDGGIDYSENLGVTWVQAYEGMGISQVYAMDSSPLNPDKIIVGLQDLGSIRRDTDGEWNYVSGGDGTQCYFDPKDDNRFYSTYVHGPIYQTNPGDTRYHVILDEDILRNHTGLDDRGGWITAFAISPQNPNRIYAGWSNIYYHDNYGDNTKSKWKSLTNNNTNTDNTFRNVRIYEKDDNIIYAHTFSNITRTVDAGETWTFLPAPPGANRIVDIAIHPDNPDIVYATSSGYTAGNKLYKYDGDKWINISGNLPNVAVSCVTLQVEGENTKLYVGTDIGVYYGINENSHYVKWGTDMPSLIITQIELVPSLRKIRAATYGRGIWETDYHEGTHSSFSIKADGELEFCSNDSVRLYVETPGTTDIVWSTGEVGHEIWAKEAKTYTAFANASSENFLISNSIVTTTIETRAMSTEPSGEVERCQGESVTLLASSGFGSSYKWSNGATTRSITVTEPGEYYVTGRGNNAVCESKSAVVKVSFFETPASTPTINRLPFDATLPENEGKPVMDTLEAVLEGATQFRWYFNGTRQNNFSESRIVFERSSANSGQWTVDAAFGGNCFSEESTPFVSIKEATETYFEVTPKPAKSTIVLRLDQKYWGNYDISILDMRGETVLSLAGFEISAEATINIEALTEGSYIIRLSNGNRTFSESFMKAEN